MSPELSVMTSGAVPPATIAAILSGQASLGTPSKITSRSGLSSA